MSRLWSSGFELQSASAGVEWDTTVGSPSINTTTKRSGAAALRCNTTSANAYLLHQIYASAATTAHVYMRAYVYIASLPSAKTMLMAWMDDSSFGYGLRLHPDGRVRIEASNDFAFSSFSAGLLSTGQWYRIEIDYNDSTDTATAYVNGSSVATISSADTFGGDRFMVGSFDAVTADLYFDDVAINDASGSAQTGLPGAGSIVHMQPDATGDSTQWQSSSSTTTGSATVGAINEVTPDDATTYNRRTTTTTKIDDWNMESASSAGIGASDTITLVEHGGRYGSTSTTATARTVVKRLKGQASGTVSSSASTSIAVNGWTTHQAGVPRVSNLVAYANPQTGAAWTPSALDSMQVGVQANTSSTNEIRYSTLWALVEYVPAASHIVTGTAYATAGSTAACSTTRTTAPSAVAISAASAVAQTARTYARTAGSVVTATAAAASTRSLARSAIASAVATTTRSSSRTYARTAFAVVAATAVSRAVKAAARTAYVAIAATATWSTVRAKAATAGALAGASAISSSGGGTKAVTAYATAGASAVARSVRTRTVAAEVSASGRASATGQRTRVVTGSSSAGASATVRSVRTMAVGGVVVAGTRAVSTSVRPLVVIAHVLVTARVAAAATVQAIKVREGGAWVGATPRVRQAGVWVTAKPTLRENGSWHAY